MTRTAVLSIFAALATPAAATNYFGAGGSIPDGGGPGNQFSSSIVIGDTYNIADINVTLNGANHTFVGDLIITLTNGSTSVVLVDRPGVPDFSVFGWAYNIAGDYTFDDAASTTWQNANGGVQDDFLTLASGSSWAPENPLSAFNGQSVAGTWTLTISDNATIDTGGISGWTLTAVPSPAGLALLGLGTLGAARRRR